MDPVTGLSLACNIYTFVEAGFKVIRQYNDFRQNRLDETRNNTDRRLLAERLRAVSSDLISDGPPPLVVIGGDCRKLCDELLELLDKLSVKNPDSKRDRIGVILKSYLRSPDISSLEKRLNLHKEQLMLSLLQSLRSEQKGEQKDLRTKLDDIQLELSQLRDPRSKQLTELRSDLLKALQLQADTASRIPFDEFGRMLSQLRDIVTTCGPEAAILMQLQFNEMYGREDTIKSPTEGTALWPLLEGPDGYEESSESSNSRVNLFAPWIRSGSGVFHVSGKAGSGKSTLMKHIWLHDRTQEHLESWAGNKKLLKAAFFFWASGNEEQRSMTGLFRSILFCVLSRDKSLIPQIFPQCWENGHFIAHSVAAITRPDVMEASFHTLLRKAKNSEYRICLFIDGLDEFEAADRESYWELAKQLGDWADYSDGDVKLCVSSRPYDEFQNIFRPSQSPSRTQIHLHQLNQGDIERHCKMTLSVKAKDCPNLFKIMENYDDGLVGEIVRRAEGVFLWAIFVVRMIVSEGRRG
ncbi:hypothetical protein F5Y08DRAFT_114357 [Xylaria arbuscula]|nr:hypothetical protein F5Y08DRAFT_114357 [Xylaria arbuscula]